MTIQPEHIERLARSIALTLEAVDAERADDVHELREEVAALGAKVDALERQRAASVRAWSAPEAS